MKPNPRIAIPVVLILAGIAAAAFYVHASREEASTLTLYGNVDIREVELAFRVPGRLASMDVEEGETVTAGQRLAQIDPQPYEDALAAAEAGVLQARANVDKLESGARPQEVQQARAAVREADAAAKDAERNFERQKGLVESGAASQRILDAAAAQHDATAARLASADNRPAVRNPAPPVVRNCRRSMAMAPPFRSGKCAVQRIYSRFAARADGRLLRADGRPIHRKLELPLSNR